MLSLISPKEMNEKLANWLKHVRLQQNVSQEKLALKSTVSISVIRRFERHAQISLASFIKLCFALGVNNKLLSLVEENNEYTSIEDVLLNPKKRKRASSK